MGPPPSEPPSERPPEASAETSKEEFTAQTGASLGAGPPQEEEDPAVAAVAATEAQQRLLFGGVLAEEYYRSHNVSHSAAFITNSRGMRLYTQIWTPAKSQPKALVCCCHGFGNDTSWMFQLMCVQFAAAGYAVCALDYEGHGRSDGLRVAFRRADHIVDDCIQFFASVHQRPAFQRLPCFLCGESLGGAIALLIISRSEEQGAGAEGGAGDGAGPPLQWAGCILLSPMLRIKDEMRPHWLLVTLLQGLVYFIPDAAIVPTPDTISMSCKDPERLRLAMANPHRYAGKPRLGVGVELLRITERLGDLMPRVTTPFLVVHGEADAVTDCFSSKELFACAASADKSLKLYPEGGHQLLQGEAPELRAQVWADVLGWLRARAP